ncbi:MAG: hypothetical protein FH748_16100 [Balneolaceae bacterium]|nr:hypothetical protein [Balneolaceae bacterium]
MLVFGMLFLFVEEELNAQHLEIKRSHAISSSAVEPLSRPATGTLNLIAIMVEFQADASRYTSGTGTFGPGGLPYLERADDIRIDPLPHNKIYFESHLEFAKNYYEKASDHKLTINYKVLPKVYKLDKEMAAYSPTGETFTNEKIAQLARDAWQEVEEQGGFDAEGLDPETTAFVIFHAGVGRDIELTGTSLDITPQDIPSLYLPKEQLGHLLDNPSFDGFPINDGTFRITNSLILPRTESRRGLDVSDSEFVLSLSINGLLTASIGNHLGLPDLFNTDDGNPAIGRFGLMDGAGFFAYNGLLPPEPSAWEKIFLGWESSFLIDTDTQGDILLEASSLNAENNIARYNLSSSEYFLIENRHRDPDQTGITLTIRDSTGIETLLTFTNEDDAFIFQESQFDTLLAPGVVTDADNFDFSLPGGMDNGADGEEDTNDDRELNGGILIWHIDEAMINSQLSSGGINNNRFRRGVDLEEADGAQDIGPGIPGSLNNSVAFGTSFDFWWSQNNYRVIRQNGSIQLYENRFGADTYPNTNSNTGAPSFFELYDFSDNLPVASFKIRAISPEEGPSLSHDTSLNTTSVHSPLQDTYSKNFPLALDQITENGESYVVVPSAAGDFIYSLTSKSVQSLNNEVSRQAYTGPPLVTVSSIDQGQEITLKKWERGSGNQWVSTAEHTIPANSGLTSSENNNTLEIDASTYGINLTPFTLEPNYRNEAVQQSKILNNHYSRVVQGQVEFVSDENIPSYSPGSSTNRLYTGSVELLDGNTGFFILTEGKLIFVNPAHSSPFTTLYKSEHIGWPAIVDFNHDQQLDFIFVDYTTNQLIAVNQNGGILDFFPHNPGRGIRISGTPLVADLENDGNPDLVVPSRDSLSFNLHLFDHTLSEHSFSPLYTGGINNPDALPLNPVLITDQLFAVSPQGDLKSWKFDEIGSVRWAGKYGNHPYNKVSALLAEDNTPKPTFSVLNDAETYNWPNPSNDHTYIRFEVAEPGGKVEIKIANLSGRIIFEQEAEAMGGAPEEIRVNTSNWGNGGYFALVKATVNGETETKLIKIGVVH